MIIRLEDHDGKPCDLTGEPMREAVGMFARGATGRMCLVMVVDKREGDSVITLSELERKAAEQPGGYLDY